MRSEFTRKTADIGPTVLDQAAYALPADFDRGLRLTVDAVPYRLSDQEDGEELALNNRQFGSQAIYYQSFDSSGTEQYSLYPAPATAGLTIALTYVFTPADLSAGSDTPSVPARFHRAITDYARGEAFGVLEDNPELEQFYKDKFEAKVGELAQLRIARAGRGPAQMRVSGVHW